MVPITGRASSFLVFFVCTLRGWSFQKQNREEERGTEQQQTNQFTQGYNILHRLQIQNTSDDKKNATRGFEEILKQLLERKEPPGTDNLEVTTQAWEPNPSRVICVGDKQGCLLKGKNKLRGVM